MEQDHGRAALVTGGSSGIGYGIAEALLRDGYGVTVVARREAKLHDAARRLAAFGDVLGVVADVRDEEAIEAAVADHRTRFGGMDVLVNNAGVALGDSIAETTGKTIDLAMSINLRSAMLFTRASLEMLIAAAPSYVINVASLTGLRPQPGMAAYSASKAALIAFTDAFRAELAGDGVRATAIAPGFVDTAMSDVVRPYVDASELIQVDDVVALFRTLIHLSPACVVPVVAIEGIGGGGLEPWARASYGSGEVRRTGSA
jgi:NAD(P)-dependent dehydrogenase (short-subunit alcohol dehydrogenase family)